MIWFMVKVGFKVRWVGRSKGWQNTVAEVQNQDNLNLYLSDLCKKIDFYDQNWILEKADVVLAVQKKEMV